MTRRLPLLALCLLATCTGSRYGGKGRGAYHAGPIDASAGGVVRLLDSLGRATIHAPQLAVMEGELEAPAAGALAMGDELSPAAVSGGAWPGAWFDEKFLGAAIAGLPEAATMPHASMLPEIVDGDTVVRLAAASADAPGASLSTVVPAAEDATWLVSARMRALAPAPKAPTENVTRPSLAWVPITGELPRADELATRAAKFAEQWRARPRRALLPDEAAGGAPGSHASWHELRLVARPYPGRRGIVVTVAGGDCGALVDRVEVRRLTPLEALALSADDSVEPVVHPLRRHIELDLETFDALALPVPGRAEFAVTLPEQHARLEVAFAARSTGGAPVRLSVRVAGVERAASQPSARFARATIDLSDHGGKTVTIELAAEGPAGSVALFGAPTLLGAARAASPARNVLLISLDTLRADHLGCYGGDDATPRIDRLASEGTRFEQVISPASYTLPTHLSMLSGQDPLVHETVLSTQPMDPARTSMLARRFADAGGRTAAFTGGGLVHPRYGFGVGFDSYCIRDPGGVVGLHRRIGDEPDLDAAPGEDRVGRIVDWMSRSADVPFFLFVHTYLVHNYRPSQADLDAIQGGTRPTREQLELLRQAAAKGERAALDRMRLLYRASIRQADREVVGRLLDALDALKLAESTLVVLVADHGEEFFEHGMLGHGDELWHDLTRVPWILRGPGVAHATVRSDPVALADVAPTVAALLGLPPDPRVLGQDQLATDPADNLDGPFAPKLLSLRRLADRPDQDAVVLWPWKLVQRRAAAPADPAAPIPPDPPALLFDLANDPGETRDLAAAEPKRVAGLARLLKHQLQAAAASVRALPSSKGERRFELSPELERMLDQLGYVQDDR